MTDRDTARAAKDQLRAELGRLPGVTGIGLGRRQGDYVITVSVTEQAACDHVPAHFHGVTVEVRVSGHVRTLPGGTAADAGSPGPGPSGATSGGAPGPTGSPQVTSDPVGTPPSAAGDARQP